MSRAMGWTEAGAGQGRRGHEHGLQVRSSWPTSQEREASGNREKAALLREAGGSVFRGYVTVI